MTYAHGAGTVTPLLGLLALLFIGANFHAQAVRPAQAQVRRLTARQQRNLIKYNEAGTITTLRILFSAEATYQSTTGNGNYGTIEELAREHLIDPVLAEGHRYGYFFRIRREKSSSESRGSLEIVAVPQSYRRTGRRSFYISETGVIHAADKHGAEANPKDDNMVIDP